MSTTDRAWIRQSLTGPVASIRTPFEKDGSIDYDGLRRAIDFNIEAGSKTILLTAGDSHYVALSDEEISEVTRVTVAHTGRRALVVAADRCFSTRRALAFADYCRGIGVHVLMLMPPDWGASCTPETLSAYYTHVAEQIPVMVVTNVFIPRGEAFGLRTIEKTLVATNHVVAIKDDMCGVFARKMCLLVHDRWAVFAGGQKQNHMNMHPYGCDGYLSTFITFRPAIAHRYWAAIESANLAAAAAVIRDYDIPFFDWVMGMPGGFDAGIHGVLELFGICKRWRRPPYYSLNDADMERLREGLRSRSILANE